MSILSERVKRMEYDKKVRKDMAIPQGDGNWTKYKNREGRFNIPTQHITLQTEVVLVPSRPHSYLAQFMMAL